MPHLAVIRRGWQNEHLSAFMLSRFAFIAHPAKIGDDIGTDFFCTFFETIRQSNKDYLIPKGSFAIQVKSCGGSINVTKQIDFLHRLELPFFVGVVNQKNSSLTIYSGEYLPILFPHKGLPNKLTLKLCPKHDFAPDNYFEQIGEHAYKLRCPKISTFSVFMKDREIEIEATRIRKLAERIQKNIAARASDENIYAVGIDGGATVILAGPGSVQVFRENFKRQLAEVFHNIAWILDRPDRDLDISEFRFYERIYDDMRKREKDLPIYLTEVAENLKKQINSA